MLLDHFHTNSQPDAATHKVEDDASIARASANSRSETAKGLEGSQEFKNHMQPSPIEHESS